MRYCNFLLLKTLVTKWVGLIPGSLQSLNSPKGPPFRLSHVLPSFSLVCGAWRVACVQFYFQYQGSTQKPTYMMTCTYDFYDVIFASKVPSCQAAIYWVLRGQLFLSRITSPKSTFFQKFDLCLKHSARYFQRANKS